MKEIKLDYLYDTPIFTIKSTDPQWKDVYGAVFVRDKQAWCFPAFRPVHESVLNDLTALDPEVKLSETASQHLDQLNKKHTLPKDFSFITQPYQHQIEGLEHLVNNIRAGLFLSPGLGKCKIVIDLLRYTQDTALILCPKIMLNTWKEEFAKHGHIEDITIIDGTKKKKTTLIQGAASNPPSAIVVTFDTAARYYKELFKIPYKCIVADESHRLKSPFSKRTKAAQELSKRAYRRILLSGTPSLGSPFDMYGQLRFLGKFLCPEGWWKFKKKFGVFPPWEQSKPAPKILIGFKNVHIMNDRVNRVCIRKTKEDCLDLPDQQIIDKKFGLYSSQKKEYNSLILNRGDPSGYGIRDQLEQGVIDHSTGTTLTPHVITDEVITLLGKLDQLASGFIHKTQMNPALCNGCEFVQNCTAEGIQPYTTKCKIIQTRPATVVARSKKNARLDLCQELLEDILADEDNKVILWANYKAELEDLCKLADKLNVKYVKVAGGLSREKLDEKVKTFNTDKTCRLYISQVSTGIGITLNAANYVIYYNLPWSLDSYLQSLDRNYRIGQTKKVTVYRLVATHTLDESKAVALDQKVTLDKLVTNSTPCITCPDFVKRCAANNIKLYDEQCKYDRTMMRATADVKVIP